MTRIKRICTICIALGALLIASVACLAICNNYEVSQAAASAQETAAVLDELRTADMSEPEQVSDPESVSNASNTTEDPDHEPEVAEKPDLELRF